MKSMTFTWKITVSVDEDEKELTYSDFKDCAWNKVEEEDCEYDFCG